MTIKTLDVSKLPTAYRGTFRGESFDLGATLNEARMRPVVEAMMASGLVKKSDSFGFALANPTFGERTPGGLTYHNQEVWDDPYTLVALTVYWGPEGPRYAANAVRKLRPAARVGDDTLQVRLTEPEWFEDKVDSQEEDGSFAWGDFPYGGGTHHHLDDLHLLGAVSALKEEEDHGVTGFFLSAVGLQLRPAA